MKMLKWLLISLALTLVSTGCGDDTSDAAEDSGMDADVNDPPPPPPPEEDAGPSTFECGAITCSEPEIDTSGLPDAIAAIAASMPDLVSGLLMVQGCCTDNADNPCGVMAEQGCVQQAQPGEPNDACPSVNVDVMGQAIELAGCCKPEGLCGFDFGVLGIGCMEREEAAMSNVMGMSLPDAGMIMSISCDAGGDPDSGTDADAGN